MNIKETDEDFFPTKNLVDGTIEKMKSLPENTREIVQKLVDEIEYLFFVISAYGENEGYLPCRATRKSYDASREKGRNP